MFLQLIQLQTTIVSTLKMILQISTVLILKIWSTVKISGTSVPQNATVPVGRPRPYSIIILNMRFIPKASLRASSQITDSRWALLCKQTDSITVGISKRFDPTPTIVPTSGGAHNMCMTLYNVGSAAKTLGRRCINVIQMFCFCWARGLSLKHCTFLQCWLNVGQMLA